MLKNPTSNLKSTTTNMEKLLHIHYFYQTKPKKQCNFKTELKKQPEKRRVHTGQTNNNQKENLKKARVFTFITK
jgi:hypothetical protein